MSRVKGASSTNINLRSPSTTFHISRQLAEARHINLHSFWFCKPQPRQLGKDGTTCKPQVSFRTCCDGKHHRRCSYDDYIISISGRVHQFLPLFQQLNSQQRDVLNVPTQHDRRKIPGFQVTTIVAHKVVIRALPEEGQWPVESPFDSPPVGTPKYMVRRF